MIPLLSESSNEHAPIRFPKRECIAGAALALALGAIGAGVYFAVTGNLGPSAYVPMLAVGGITAAVSTVALVILSKRRKTGEIGRQPLLSASPPEAAAEKHPPKAIDCIIGDKLILFVNLVWDEEENRYTAKKTPDPITIRGTFETDRVYVWNDHDLCFYIKQ